MELSIQERLKDLRVERGLTLEQLAEQTHLSKSALVLEIQIIEIQFKILTKDTSGWVSWFPTPPPEPF